MGLASTRTLLAADSFRVRKNPQNKEAEVRGLDLHIDRFARAVLDCWPAQPEPKVLDLIDAFLAEALPAIAAYGDGFPRLELWQSSTERLPELSLALRPVPVLTQSVELRSVAYSDLPKLSARHRKGPNIEAYAALNRSVHAEALLVDQAGHVLEGATTSLIWWPNEPTSSGCYVDDRLGQRVTSVTERLLREAAESQSGDPRATRWNVGALSPRLATTATLSRSEVWAVNALHGIRPVSMLDGSRLCTPDPERRRWFQEALDHTWQPVASTQVQVS